MVHKYTGFKGKSNCKLKMKNLLLKLIKLKFQFNPIDLKLLTR